MSKRFRRQHLNVGVVEGLQPGQVVMDTDEPSFGVRRQKGKRVFFLRKWANGARHFETIGEYATGGARERGIFLLSVNSRKFGSKSTWTRKGSHPQRSSTAFSCAASASRRRSGSVALTAVASLTTSTVSGACPTASPNSCGPPIRSLMCPRARRTRTGWRISVCAAPQSPTLPPPTSASSGTATRGSMRTTTQQVATRR
jgi:hypothetical protein